MTDTGSAETVLGAAGEWEVWNLFIVESLLRPLHAFSLWTYVVYGGILLALIFALLRWRTASLKHQREQLERTVTEQTKELRRQTHRLETYNQELLRANKQLRRTVEEKSKLLGVAAHDLKNPIFGIRALSEIVLENEEVRPRVERKLTLIQESAEDTLHLIDNLLSSAASTAQVQADSAPVDVAALAQWVVHSFEPQAERKNQTLHCSVPEAACVVTGDKRKLREAIANLVSNALKYSPSGEAVDVTVDRQAETILVAVSDPGPGLSENDQQRMFAPFQRLSPTPTGDESSSGLGLYIVKQIVDLHEGDIEVESTLGVGSTFTLRFPITTAEVDAVPQADPASIEDA